MKKILRKYIVWITLILLTALLFFQVKWIIYSVRFQEKVFKNSVDLAMNKTIANLHSDQMVCNAMRECMRCDTSRVDSRVLSREIWNQIHSSIDSELAVYNINLDYDLFITRDNGDTIRNGTIDLLVRRGICYAQSLRELLQTSGYNLVVRFPSRTRFFLNEAGLMLLSSVLLILLIIFFYMQLVSLYRDELRLSDNIRELINNVTHEFKTPMSSISLASNLIRKGKPEAEKMREYGDLIFRENMKLQRQVDSLLDLAAIERDDFDYQLKPENLNNLVTDALNTVKLQTEERNGKVKTNFTEDEDGILADKTHLTNAIVNLLSNALKYSEQTPEISIRTFSREGQLLLEIKDQGIGIPAKYQRYIFDKYYRVPTGDVHNIKGFGIGLSYVKSVVAAHNGKITVQSEPEKGSTFTLMIPQFIKR